MKHAMFALAALAIFMASAASAKGGDSVYQVELTLQRDGLPEPWSQSFVVEPGAEAVLSLLHESEPIGHQLRLVVGEPFVTPTGKSAAALRVQLFEQVEREWSLRASPSLGIELGKMASTSGPLLGSAAGGQYALAMSISLIARVELEPQKGEFSAMSVACDADLLAPLSRATASRGVAKDGGGSPRCCRVGCAGGSIWFGYTMTCCGAIWCCDCGVCCYPP
jgi:hypothetical protein